MRISSFNGIGNDQIFIGEYLLKGARDIPN